MTPRTKDFLLTWLWYSIGIGVVVIFVALLLCAAALIIHHNWMPLLVAVVIGAGVMAWGDVQ